MKHKFLLSACGIIIMSSFGVILLSTIVRMVIADFGNALKTILLGGLFIYLFVHLSWRSSAKGKTDANKSEKGIKSIFQELSCKSRILPILLLIIGFSAAIVLLSQAALSIHDLYLFLLR